MTSIPSSFLIDFPAFQQLGLRFRDFWKIFFLLSHFELFDYNILSQNRNLSRSRTCWSLGDNRFVQNLCKFSNLLDISIIWVLKGSYQVKWIFFFLQNFALKTNLRNSHFLFSWISNFSKFVSLVILWNHFSPGRYHSVKKNKRNFSGILAHLLTSFLIKQNALFIFFDRFSIKNKTLKGSKRFKSNHDNINVQKK